MKYAQREETFKLKPPHAKDSYKIGHPEQYPDDTRYVYSNLTPRSNRLLSMPANLKTNKIVWVGIQGVLMDYVALWNSEFFDKPLEEILAAWVNRIPAFTGNPNPDTERLTKLWNLGYLPLHVKALQEGSLVNIGIPCFTIVNTNPDFGWLTNSTETYLSNESWKAPTIATIAYAYRRLLDSYAEMTGTPADFVDWQGHCFADRGMSGMIDAAKTLIGHDLSFLGSDSVSTVDYLDWAYFAAGSFVSGSVPATEHAVMCLGMQDGEKETIRRLITKIYPTGIASIVADTWDFWHTISVTAAELKEEILNRIPNELGIAKVVFRPDSGNPVDIICGLRIFKGTDISSVEYPVLMDDHYDVIEVDGKYFRYEVKWETGHGGESWGHHVVLQDEVPEVEVKGAVEVLWDIFGGTETNQEYRLLHERVGLIYGDSITLERAEQIMSRLAAKRFASGCVVLGIGSYTYQYLTRDTLGWAIKATWGDVGGVGREIFKDPVTDIGKTKKSAKGLLRVEKEGDDFVLYDQQTPEQEKQGELKTVLLDGLFPNLVNWKQVRTVLGAVMMNV